MNAQGSTSRPEQGHRAPDVAEIDLALTQHVHEPQHRRDHQHEARHEQHLLDLARVRVADLADHVRVLADPDLRFEDHRQQTARAEPATMQMPATILRKWWALERDSIVPSFQGHPNYTALVTIVTYCTSDCTTAS